ncbi:hypothetical protein GCM10010182_63100 [Actinomadura cremea]|nr:hypothetical protein GCM10010182_63100 [Actinomadura cremea]
MARRRRLALAADNTELVRNVQLDRIFHDHVHTAIGVAPEDLTRETTYDMFTSMAHQDRCLRFVTMGYLATRGNGDSSDHHPALPGACQ